MTECNKSVYLANKSIDMIDAVNKGYTDGYNKAINDFTEKLIRYIDCGHLCSPTEMRWSDLSIVEMVKRLAEQLKAGGENEMQE